MRGSYIPLPDFTQPWLFSEGSSTGAVLPPFVKGQAVGALHCWGLQTELDWPEGSTARAPALLYRGLASGELGAVVRVSSGPGKT